MHINARDIPPPLHFCFIIDTPRNILSSKLICAEVSRMTGPSKQVFHQTVNAQNSMLTRQIHDQGKDYFFNRIYFVTCLLKYTECFGF